MLADLRCRTRKQPHLTREDAQRHLRSLKDYRSGYGGEPYHCRHCGCWHVGRPKRRAHRSKYA